MKLRDSRNIYPKKAILVFLTLPKSAVLDQCGLGNLPSPNHVLAFVHRDGEDWFLYDPIVGQVDVANVHIYGGHERSVINQILATDYEGFVVDNIFDVSILGAPRIDMKLYGRPMYCHNFLAYLLGLEVGATLTTLVLRDDLIRLNGHKNFVVEVLK